MWIQFLEFSGFAWSEVLNLRNHEKNMSEMVKNIYFNEFLNFISHQLQTTPTKIVFKFHYKSMNTFLHSDTLGVSQSKFARNYEWN